VRVKFPVVISARNIEIRPSAGLSPHAVSTVERALRKLFSQVVSLPPELGFVPVVAERMSSKEPSPLDATPGP
jgi:hypothetical protein